MYSVLLYTKRCPILDIHIKSIY